MKPSASDSSKMKVNEDDDKTIVDLDKTTSAKHKKVKRRKTRFFRYNKKKSSTAEVKNYAKLSEVDKGIITGLRNFVDSNGKKFKTSEIWKANKSRGWGRRNTFKEVERLNERSGDTRRQQGSGRRRTARTNKHIENVAAKKDESIRKLAKEEGISRESARRILKKDLNQKPLKKIRVHSLDDEKKQKRRLGCEKLLQNYRGKSMDIIFSDEKYFELVPPINIQNERVWVPKNMKKSDVSPER